MLDTRCLIYLNSHGIMTFEELVAEKSWIFFTH